MNNTNEKQRYDQRDALVYRSQLKSGSKEYNIYYELHPELEEMDNKTRVHYNESAASEVRLKQFPEDKLANAWVHSAKKTTSYLLRDAVDGPVNEDKIEVDPAIITDKIKNLAKYFGAGTVGVCKLNQAWVYSHHGQWPNEEWGKPVNLPHKYAIVMAFPHNWDIWLTGAITSIPGCMDDWNYYNNMANTAIRLAAAIRDMGYPARAQIQSNYNCVLPPLAVDAGLGEQCRISICLTKEYGLAYRLCAVTTDLPLIPDPPSNLGIEDFCNKCTKCADVCPSGAISREGMTEINGVRMWKQDVLQCFRYWNTKGVSCTICRRACPWSKPPTLMHRITSSLAENVPLIRSALIKADDIVYGKKPRYHPPPKWLQTEEKNMSFKQKLLYWFDHQ